VPPARSTALGQLYAPCVPITLFVPAEDEKAARGALGLGEDEKLLAYGT
jgi:hypothetical protein